ncbi:MAG: HipA domain-containing protein [Chloroherpetonaceae bacterium]|nr:HipA domain-containing protein [Chloroherpetonaceae bacterium]
MENGQKNEGILHDNRLMDHTPHLFENVESKQEFKPVHKTISKKHQDQTLKILAEKGVCPGSLAEEKTGYGISTLRSVFFGKKVKPILPFPSPLVNERSAERFLQNRKSISIPGVHEKVSLIQEKNRLRLTEPNEFGTHLLKPIPRDLLRADQVPANESLTLQIAKQVYGIAIAECALIFFENEVPAFITKRFDQMATIETLSDEKRSVRDQKLAVEDFTSLLGLSPLTHGNNYKRESSYETVGKTLKKYVPAWRIEIEKLFQRILFSFLFSNGNFHLKNISLIETTSGDMILSPAYDIKNTELHEETPVLSLQGGLFDDHFKSLDYEHFGYPSKIDFVELARRFEIPESRIHKILAPFITKQPEVKSLIDRSFLKEEVKKLYYVHYLTRLNYLEGT